MGTIRNFTITQAMRDEILENEISDLEIEFKLKHKKLD